MRLAQDDSVRDTATPSDVPTRDPFQWLEIRTSLATNEWLTVQNRLYQEYFARCADLGAIQSLLQRCLDLDSCDQAVTIGQRLFFRRRAAKQEQASIYVRDCGNGSERTLVDPSASGMFASVSMHGVSSNGEFLAYELKRDGSAVGTIYVIDTYTGRTLDGHLPPGYQLGFAFSNDNRSFYYCQENCARSGEHVVRQHFLGSSVESDAELFRAPRSAGSRLVLTADDVNLAAVYTSQRSDGPVCEVFLASQAEAGVWTSILKGQRSAYLPLLYHGRLFYLTQEGAPNRKIIEILTSPQAFLEVIPETRFLLQQVQIAAEHLYVSYIVNGVPRIYVHTLTGEYVRTVALPPHCSASLITRPRSQESIVYRVESFTQPPQLFECGNQSSSPHALFHINHSAGMTVACRYEEVTYSSSDGTTIPMLIAMREDLDRSRPTPTLLTSYGGFGISATPTFSPLFATLLELGMVIAMPGIRGGAEFGKQWHEAAKGKNRQRSFDDFIAGAEWLIAQGITNPRKLASYGASNAGLLMAVAMIQRPDLFRAVIAMGPLLDMIRYEQLDPATKWRKEFGSVEKPEEFQALLAYSPYHNVREDVNYPSILLVTGDADDRCNPAHVRKMAALLQSRTAQQNPIVVDYSRERGHSPGLPLSVRITSMARRIAFLLKELETPVTCKED